MDLKTIQLFGKPLFNLVTMSQSVKLMTSMPEDEAAFVYVLSGACINHTETETLELSANHAVLAKCGNSTFRTIPTNGKTEYKALVIKFHKDVLEALYEQSVSPFQNAKNHPIRVNSSMVDTNVVIDQYILSILNYFDHPELVSDSLLKIKLNELIVLLLQTGNTPEVLGIMTNLYERHTLAFKEVIKAHICSPLTLSELARLSNLSLSSFKKRFREVYDDTPNNYLIRKRIELVAEMIPVSNKSLSLIAYDCEFKTLAHMSRVFKNTYGVSPSQYRLNLSDKL